jgi:SAM-dependent methyltransferase
MGVLDKPMRHPSRTTSPRANVDEATVAGFGEEWGTYDQAGLSLQELEAAFERYFRIFPWDRVPPNANGFDAGCGSGRWAKLVAPRVGQLHCVDASPAALAVAKRNLTGRVNCEFHEASVAGLPFSDGSMDFGYSLGVLHHIPDTQAGITACVRKLKPGAPFLIYLYYALENRPVWFRMLWRGSDALRRRISALRMEQKLFVTDLIARCVYWPLARISLAAERLGISVENIPLSMYRHASFYSMRTDALDRFGTRLEKRFTAQTIRSMLEHAGLSDIRFSDAAPYWCAVGFRRPPHARKGQGEQ